MSSQNLKARSTVRVVCASHVGHQLAKVNINRTSGTPDNLVSEEPNYPISCMYMRCIHLIPIQ